MEKKCLVLAVVILSIFGAAIPAYCAPADLRIGYVDLQKALAASKAGMAAQKEYEKEVKQMQSKLDLKKEEFEKQRQDFQKQKDSLSDEAKTSREEKLIALEKDLKRSFEDSQELLRRKNGVLVSDLLGKIRKVVDKVGQDDAFTIILEKGGQAVLYASSSIDITDKVVKNFDAASN